MYEISTLHDVHVLSISRHNLYFFSENLFVTDPVLTLELWVKFVQVTSRPMNLFSFIYRTERPDMNFVKILQTTVSLTISYVILKFMSVYFRWKLIMFYDMNSWFIFTKNRSYL